MLLLPHLPVTMQFERCRIWSCPPTWVAMKLFTADCDDGTSGGHQTEGFPWEKVAQLWHSAVLFPAELPEELCIGKTSPSPSTPGWEL